MPRQVSCPRVQGRGLPGLVGWATAKWATAARFLILAQPQVKHCILTCVADENAQISGQGMCQAQGLLSHNQMMLSRTLSTFLPLTLPCFGTLALVKCCEQTGCNVDIGISVDHQIQRAAVCRWGMVLQGVQVPQANGGQERGGQDNG
jgi:hypothetical protein